MAAVVAVLAAAVLAVVALTGDSSGGLTSTDDAETQVQGLFEEFDLSQFGSPTAVSVTCPATLPGETNVPFKCQVDLSTGGQATMEVAFANEDGKIDKCSLFSKTDGWMVLTDLFGDTCPR